MSGSPNPVNLLLDLVAPLLRFAAPQSLNCFPILGEATWTDDFQFEDFQLELLCEVRGASDDLQLVGFQLELLCEVHGASDDFQLDDLQPQLF